METLTEQAQRRGADICVLRFAQMHDWGREAYLWGNEIRGLRDGDNEISLPLDMKTLRDWAGY